jgi:excisionase family DNA binding protein
MPKESLLLTVRESEGIFNARARTNRRLAGIADQKDCVVSTSPPSALPLLLDVATAAQTLSISVRYLRLLISRRKVPAVRLGRRVLVRRRDIDAVVEHGGLDQSAG